MPISPHGWKQAFREHDKPTKPNEDFRVVRKRRIEMMAGRQGVRRIACTGGDTDERRALYEWDMALLENWGTWRG